MDPRKKTADELKGAPLSFLKSDELKGPPICFMSAHQTFSTDDLEDGQAISLHLSDTESQHSSGLRLATLEGLHTVAGMRLPVSQSMSHGLQLSVSDAEAMHSAGIRMTDAETAHAAAMRLNDDNDPLHNSTLRLSEAEIPHPGGGGLRLPLSTADYGLSNMYSMSSILSGTPEARPVDVSNKRDLYDLGLSRPQSMRFGIYEKDGRLPGISYMMSTQESSMRAAGLDMSIPNLPVISSSATHDANTNPLINSHVSFTSTVASTPQTLFSGRGYGIPGSESDSDSELADAAAIHSNLAEAQERFASHLGRMDMKSIIEATKLAVAQQQLNHLPAGPLDMKHQDTKDLERQLIMRDAEMDALSSSLPAADHMVPVDVTSLTSHHTTLTDMGQLTDGHVTDLTTTGQLTDGHMTELTATDLSGHQSTDSDSLPLSSEKGERLMFDRHLLPAHWFHEFPWLLMDSTLNLYYCRYCMQTNSNSALAKGRTTLRPRKSYFVKHDQTEEHRSAAAKFLGMDTDGHGESQEVIVSTSQALALDSMPLTWSTTPTVSSKLEELQPVTGDFATLTPTSTSQFNTDNGPDPAQKPMIIDSTNAHVLNLVSSPRTLAETRAQFEGWFDDFLWLVYNAQLNVFICKVCQQAGLPGLPAMGKEPDQLQRAPFEEHQRLGMHMEAARALQDDNPEDSLKEPESETEEVETQTFRIHRIRLAWFSEFPWLELNQTDMCFYCKQCRLYKQQGIFSYGRPAGNPRKANFVRHENTEGHKIAVLQDAGISGEEAVRTVLAMQEMINKENSDLEKGPEVNEEQLGVGPDNGVAVAHSMQNGDIPPTKPVVCSSGKTGLGRKIKLQWFIEFLWLELDENKNIVYCKLCRIYHPIGIYVSGKSAANLKRADLQKHEATEGHKIAVNSHSRAGVEGEQRLESHSLDPSNAHLIDITTVSQITYAQNKSMQNLTFSLPEILESEEEDPTVPLSPLPMIAPTSTAPPIETVPTVTTITPASDDWANQFPWYTVESPSQTAFCTVCRAECLSNALAQGVPVYVVMKKDCIVHESIEEHQRAVENARRVVTKCELKAKEAGEAAALQQAQSLSPPKCLETSSPYVTKQVPLPADALADPKTPWKSSFWHHANQMRHLGILCDVTISVGSHSNQRCYHVHKLLLICSSELFKMYLRDSTVETHYHFDNISAVGLEGVLQYIYGQPLKGMTSAQSAECCAAADVLMMPKAKELFQKVGVAAAASALKSKKKAVITEASTALLLPKQTEVLQQQKQHQKQQQQKQEQQTESEQLSPPPPVQPPAPPPHQPPEHTHHSQQQKQTELSQPAPLLSQQAEPQPPQPASSHDDVIADSTLLQPCEVPIEAANTAIVSETDCSSVNAGEASSSLKYENEGGDGLLDQSVTNKTVGQLAKKPSIIGQMRPKDRIKTYASVRSIHTRARNKIKAQPEISTGTVTRKSMREVKVNGVRLLSPAPVPPPTDTGKIKEQSPPQEVLPSPLKAEKKGKKRAKTERNSSVGKVSKKRHKGKVKDISVAEEEVKEIALELAAGGNDSEVGEWNPEIGGTEGLGLGKATFTNSTDGKAAKELPACKQCSKQFLRPAFLARHVASKHKSAVKIVVTSSTTYKCEMCPKGFPNRYDLKVHARRHTGERPYLCNVCGKSFTRRETLIEHSYIHKPDSEKPHRCEECGKGFYKIYDLQRHFVGIHSGARPFACHQCGKSFPWARSLSDHLLSHKGAARIRPYKCEECGMNFRRKYDLERHKVKHAAQKPFECEWCGHGFTQKGSMDKHKREFCHGRPGASDQQTRAVRANQSSKPSVKLEAETKLEASTPVPDIGIPAILTVTTGQHTPTTDMFSTFPAAAESNTATMLYYSI